MAAWRYEISLLMLKKYQHLERNFVPLSGHVVSSMSQHCVYQTYQIRI